MTVQQIGQQCPMMPLTDRRAALAALASVAMHHDLLVDYEPGVGLVTSDRVNGWSVIKIAVPQPIVGAWINDAPRIVPVNQETFEAEPVRSGDGSQMWQYR